MRTKMIEASPKPDETMARRLTKLGLYGVIAQWAEIDDVDLVEKIVDIEEIDRRRRSLERRVKSARIGPMKMLADFDWSWPKRIDRETIDEIFSLEFVDHAANVVFVGPNGIGKTMIAKNLAHTAVVQGRSALFVNAAELMNDLKRPDSASALSRRLAHYAKPDLLVVDELGYLAAGDRDGDLFFQLVSRRYERKSTVVTTNKPFEEWNTVFPNSACTVTLIDRLVHRAEIVCLDGESYRLKEAKEAEEKKKSARRNARSKKPTSGEKGT